MKSKKLIASVLSIALIISAAASLSSCGEEKKPEATEAATEAAATTAPEKNSEHKTAVDDIKDQLGIDLSDYGVNPDITYADDEKYGFQLDKPAKGDKIAVFHTTEGDISAKLFDKYAPKTVESFESLAKEGKYDGVIFHRVIKDFMIQGGDYENANGTGGKSADGGSFEDEFCDKLLNLRGSIAMANSGKDTNGSQFFINQNDKKAFKGFSSLEQNWEGIKSYFKQYKKSASQLASLVYQLGTSAYDTDIVPDEVRKLYDKNGGNPMLDGAYNAVDAGHTVFAQVYDGMDVVDKIANTKTGTNDKPEKDIKIKSIEIKEYK